MANFGARDVANHAAAFGLFESDPEVRTIFGSIGLFGINLVKAHEAGDQERIAALIEGVDLAAEAEAHMAEPGARERAEEIQNRLIGNALAEALGGVR